jgi:hypothetical protein
MTELHQSGNFNDEVFAVRHVAPPAEDRLALDSSRHRTSGQTLNSPNTT